MFAMMGAESYSKLNIDKGGEGKVELKNPTKPWDRWIKLDWNEERLNRINATRYLIGSKRIIVPDDRAKILKHAFEAVDKGQAKFMVCRYAPATDGSPRHLKKLFSCPPMENKARGSASLEGGWSQKSGVHIGGKIGIKWAKRQEENGNQLGITGGWRQGSGAHVGAQYSRTWGKSDQHSLGLQGGWTQRGGAQAGIGYTFRFAKDHEENAGKGGTSQKSSARTGGQSKGTSGQHSLGVHGGWSQKSGAHVTGQYSKSWGSKSSQHSLGVQGGWSQGSGAHVGGQYSKSWGKSGQHSLGVQGGWSQRGGVGAGIGYSYSFAKDQEENKSSGSFDLKGGYDQQQGVYVSAGLKINFVQAEGQEPVTLYITEIQTPGGCIYLPTFTKGKFKNLEEQILDGTAIFY